MYNICLLRVVKSNIHTGHTAEVQLLYTSTRAPSYYA